MKRRAFITLLGGAAVAWPCVGVAQPAKVPTIGVLVVGSPGSATFWRMFREDLRQLGYVEGQNIRYEFRSDEGQPGRLPDLAADLVRLKVAVLVAWFTPAATAAKRATREIPIVLTSVGDPIGTGLVDSLAHPGGNVTGVATMGADLAAKCVELIREMLPSARRIGAAANASDPFSKPFVEKISLAGPAIGITVDPIMIDGAPGLDAAFAAISKDRLDAVIVQPSLGSKHPAELALQYRIPALSIFRTFVEEGGLMSYWTQEADMYRRTAVIVDKVLKGERPAEIPVEQPTRFEVVLNMRTARTLGLTIPPTILVRVDEILQ